MADELELRLSERYYQRVPGTWKAYQKKLVLFICPVGYNEYSLKRPYVHKPLTSKEIEIVKEWIVPATGHTERSIRGRAMAEAKRLLSGGLFLIRVMQANGELKYERVERPSIKHRKKTNERIAEDQGEASAAQSGGTGVGSGKETTDPR